MQCLEFSFTEALWGWLDSRSQTSLRRIDSEDPEAEQSRIIRRLSLQIWLYDSAIIADY